MKIRELGTTLAVTSSLMMEAISSSGKSVRTRATRRPIPQDSILRSNSLLIKGRNCSNEAVWIKKNNFTSNVKM
jgi:hypothetical protein